MFTHKEIELLQIAVYEAYRNTKKRKDFVEETLDDGETLETTYCQMLCRMSNELYNEEEK